MAQKIIIDCDPGVDDALALAFAHGDPGLEVRGITTVAGNAGLDVTTANALRVEIGRASCRERVSYHV